MMCTFLSLRAVTKLIIICMYKYQKINNVLKSTLKSVVHTHTYFIDTILALDCDMLFFMQFNNLLFSGESPVYLAIQEQFYPPHSK